MIETITLKAGRTPGGEPVTVQLEPVTIFVGPNNSGKTKLLQEIAEYTAQPGVQYLHVVLKSATFEARSRADAERLFDSLVLANWPEKCPPGKAVIGSYGAPQMVDREATIEVIEQPNASQNSRATFGNGVLGQKRMTLDGSTRLNLAEDQPAGDMAMHPRSPVQNLFKDDDVRNRLREAIHDGLGEFLIIEASNSGKLRFRMSEVPPPEGVEHSLRPEAITFFRGAKLLQQMSDGVRAFTGIVLNVVASDPLVLMIDEPEAFLHPPLSFKLGRLLSREVAGLGKRLLIATHSADFVMGCLQSGAPVTIVRLTYRGGIATSRVLRNEDLSKLMRDPLLRSTGVLAGLFYDCVVVTEGDTDRAFYDEINERLLAASSSRGIPNCLFVNAQGKDTVYALVKPLRKLGIPVAAILDLDVIKVGGENWKRLLNAAGLPDLDQKSLSDTRAALARRFEESGLDMNRGGITLLKPEDAEAATNFLDRLSEYGLFVVRRGEVESWLPEVGATGQGPRWLVKIFEAMGSDPEVSDYRRPADDDVWEFVGEVTQWLTNPSRKGIPA